MTTSQPEWRSVDNSECISCDRRAGTPGRMDLGVRKFKCSTHASPGMGGAPRPITEPIAQQSGPEWT